MWAGGAHHGGRILCPGISPEPQTGAVMPCGPAPHSDTLMDAYASARTQVLACTAETNRFQGWVCWQGTQPPIVHLYGFVLKTFYVFLFGISS